MWSILIQNSKLLRYVLPDTYAIALYPFILCNEEIDNFTLNHEKIHLKQQCELWGIGFYFLYIYYLLQGKWSGKSSMDAYLDIPFESEAYENETNLEYLKKREKMSWMKYRN